MKKLIISIVATASLALVAKADVAPNATSFENYSGDFAVGKTDNGGEPATGELYWSGGDEGQFEFIDVVAGAKTFRPKYWDGTTPDAKALSIDTDVALSRNVAAGGAPQTIGAGLYFDSMVQFTATDTPPTVTKTTDDVTGDKLIVWMREVVAGNETPATYALYVTAGVKDQSVIKTTHYELTNVADIAPDSWHRLTIAISKTGETPTFKVYVDGEVAQSTKIYNPDVEDGEYQTLERAVEEFGSLTSAQETNSGTLTSVSFQGKGAIDDLVWTTEDPFVAPTKTSTVTIVDTDENGIWSYSVDGGADVAMNDGENTVKALADANEVVFKCELGNGYSLLSSGFVAGTPGESTTIWTKPVKVAELETGYTFTPEEVEEPVEPVVRPFTVTIGENEERQFETLAEAIAAADGKTIKLTQAATLTEKLTVAEDAVIDLNGQTLTLANVEDNYAVVIKAALTITDSTEDKAGKVIVPGFNGFGMTAGSLTIDAGNFVGATADYLIGAWDGTVTISGGNFSAAYCVLNLFGGKPKAVISNGTFTVAEKDVTGQWDSGAVFNEDGAEMAISGGRFSTVLDEAFCAEGYVPTTEADDDGYYTVEEKADEKPTAGENELEVEDFADPAIVNSTTEVTLPEGWTVSEDKTQILNKDSQPFVTFPSYYTATVVNGVIKLALNDTVKPVIAESKVGETTVKPMEFAKEGEADVVKLNVPVRNDNLFYGVKAAGTLTGLDGATPAWATARGVNPPAVPKSGNAQFFRVVVTDVLPAQN